MIGQGLTLITGATGSGKTALVVSWLAAMEGQRPIVVMGIPDLKVDHGVAPPVEEWVEQRPDKDDPSLLLPYFTFPPGSIVVLDEAQRVFRPRSAGSKVPPAVAAFETRRHTGCDFVLLTQHEGLLDVNVRRLVNRHVHVHTTFGGRFLLEWPGLGSPDDASSRDLASRKRYKPDKRVFKLYKSAELHTKVVRRVPWQMYALFVLVPLLGVLGWYAYDRISSRMDPVAAVPSAGPVAVPSGQTHVSTGATSYGRAPAPVSGRDVVASYKPRIEGLLHTAPVYDGLTQAVDVPRPAGCIESAKRCRCYDQRGNEYPTTAEICRQIVQRYLFVDFIPDPGQGVQRYGDKPHAGRGADSVRSGESGRSGGAPAAAVGAAGDSIAGVVLPGRGVGG